MKSVIYHVICEQRSYYDNIIILELKENVNNNYHYCCFVTFIVMVDIVDEDYVH